MSGRTKAELEAENAVLGEVLDAIADVLDDDDLSAPQKLSAAQDQLEKLDDEMEDEAEDEPEEDDE